MPLFLFVSGYLSKNAEKRRNQVLKDLFIPFLLFQLVCGCSLLFITKSTDALRSLFVPQMGGWYLLSLLGFRLLLPELSKVRGILLLSILVSVFSSVLSIGKEFALQKSLGFFVYFILGYTLSESGRVNTIVGRIPRWLARTLLILELAGFIIIVKLFDCYYSIFSLLTRASSITESWHVALYYFIAFVLTSATIALVMNSVPERNKYLEKQGEDTMPMYLSHLVLFMAAGYLVNKEHQLLAIAFSCLLCIASLLLFASKWYRNLFNSVLKAIKTSVFRSDE